MLGRKMEGTSSSQQLQVLCKRTCAPHFLFLGEFGSSVARKSNLVVLHTQIVPDKVRLAPGVPWQEAEEQVVGDVNHVPCHGVKHPCQAHIVLVPKAVTQLPAVVENLQQLGILKNCAQSILPSLHSHLLNIKHEDILSGGKEEEGKRTSPAQKATLSRHTNQPCSSHSCHGLFVNIPHLVHKVKARGCEYGRGLVLVCPEPLSDASLNRTPA